MMQLLNEENAVNYALKYLHNIGFRWNHIHPINHGRYCIVTGDDRNIAICLKRELFQSFGQLLEKQGAKGVGDSLNCKELIEFNQRGVKDIYTVFPDGKIYTIPLFEFLDKSIRWTNKEGKEVRSISIHEFKRVNDE